MIVYGTRDVQLDAIGAPIVDLEDQEPLEIKDGEILQVISELTFKGFDGRVPPALHPSHPPFATMLFYHAPDSSFGPFTMALVRVSSLAGISRFGYPIRGWINNSVAREVFGRRWGYRLDAADVSLHRRYDRVWGTVRVDGAVVLDVGLYDPEPVSGADANHAGHLNVGLVEDNGSMVPTLVQAGPQLAFRKCDRGRPHVTTFDGEAIGCDAPYWPVSSFAGHCDFLFGPVAFVCDPTVPAVDRGMTLMGSLHVVEHPQHA
ncbi:MAG TPA: acetoacetate decarboxylase family protein [Acidimicrobiales bacterium]|nr:acetoacetate decarboxylase family protein [Acidimicrobiales bacterium]